MGSIRGTQGPSGPVALVADRGVSFEALYRTCAGDAWRVARSVTGNDHDAADAVAEAASRVYQAVSSDRISGIDAFRPYLLAATRNAAVDILRRSARDRPMGGDGSFDDAVGDSVGAADPSDRAVADEESAVVARAFAELPRRWQSVLWLTEVEDLPPREAAGVLGLSPNNVSQLAVRARARLTERYLQGHVAGVAAPACRGTVEHLGAYAAGRLSRRRSAAVTSHLDGCSACRARLDHLDDLGVALRRAVVPFPLVLAGARMGWVRRIASRRRPEDVAMAQTTGPSGGAVQMASRLDPRVLDLVQRVAASPVGQGAAAVTVAAAVAVGVTMVSRDADPGPRAATVEIQAPAPSTPEPATVTTVTQPAPSPPEMAPSTTVVPTVTSRPGPALPTAPPPRLTAPSLTTVAEGTVPVVGVSDTPGAEPIMGLANPQPSGAPLVLVVQEQRGEWLNVLLSVRPNGSTGWVNRADVTLSQHRYQIVVQLGAHRITVFDGTDVLLTEAIGVGTANAPTPGGVYYTTALVEPEDAAGRYDPDGPYGPYAYPLSGFSEVLFDFAGGDGRLGIHGTNDPSGLGRDVSNGCIRMSNEGISLLAGILPLGVPVEVVA